MSLALKIDTAKTPDYYSEYFAQWVKDNTTHLPCDTDKVRSHLLELDSKRIDITATNADWKFHSEVEKILRGYIRAKLSEKYPLIPQKLFDAKRWLEIDSSRLDNLRITNDVLNLPENTPLKVLKNRVIQSLWVPIPLVATSSDRSTSVRLYSEYNAFRDRSLYLHANFPSLVSVDTLRTQLDFVKDSQKLLSDILEWDNMSVLTALDRTYTLCPTTKVGWIPKLESIYFKTPPALPPGDPIFFCEFAGGSFLLASWESAEEHPLVTAFEDMLLI